RLAESRAHFIPGNQIRERAVLISIIEIIEVGKESLPLALWANTLKTDKFARIFERQWPQHESIEDREERCINANSQRHREDGDQGEAGILYQHPQAITQVLYHLNTPT